MSAPAAAADPFAARRALRAPALLREFNDAGVLAAADVHVAACLADLSGDRDPVVMLAVALAVRGPRLGHVCVDLARIRDTATVDGEEAVDVAALPWPQVAAWTEGLARSPLVHCGEDGDPPGAAGDVRPLRLAGTRLYLDRYWREETRVAADLRTFGSDAAAGVDREVLAAGLDRLFARGSDRAQRLAAATAVLRRLAVVAGGPGTGKTTTVARIVALLCDQAAAAGRPYPRVALAAPTGKAAARLEEAVRDEAERLDVAAGVRAHLHALRASTLHRLLGRRPGPGRLLAGDRAGRLPHDVVIVDETSMVSLSSMSRLVEAMRSHARLVLVGDPAQLASIEAGAVLADVVGPAATGLRMRPAARRALAAVAGGEVTAQDPPAAAAVADGIVVLDEVHRFDAGIAAVAEAVRHGRADEALRALRAAPDEVTWIAADAADPAALRAIEPVRAAALAGARETIRAARDGDAERALEALGRFRLLCAHRRGPYGVATWSARIEQWLADAGEHAGGGSWYPGQPLLVTRNDHGLRLYNGDTGVVVAAGDGRASAAFRRGGEVATLSPARLAAVDTFHAMTIHKSQGSQFDTAAVLLPEPHSRILTRELLYTAVTRASRQLVLVGEEASIRAALERPAARASGLRERLWGDEP